MVVMLTTHPACLSWGELNEKGRESYKWTLRWRSPESTMTLTQTILNGTKWLIDNRRTLKSLVMLVIITTLISMILWVRYILKRPRTTPMPRLEMPTLIPIWELMEEWQAPSPILSGVTWCRSLQNWPALTTLIRRSRLAVSNTKISTFTSGRTFWKSLIRQFPMN